MKTVFDPAANEEILKRIDSLTAKHKAEWGTMNVSQMLAHCAAAAQMVSGKITPKRVWIGRFIGPLFKSVMSNDQPFRKNTPTAPEFVAVDAHDFEKERGRLRAEVLAIHESGAKGVTKAPHPFFGKLTPEAWGIAAYKHLDHHLRQFGV